LAKALSHRPQILIQDGEYLKDLGPLNLDHFSELAMAIFWPLALT
jgi:hypothetical protein